jgi:hypothetical protein
MREYLKLFFWKSRGEKNERRKNISNDAMPEAALPNSPFEGGRGDVSNEMEICIPEQMI